MASSLLSEELLCPICLEVFTDPISTPCGHNYCNACITQHWDTSEACRCPLCQTTFNGRPKLSVNTVLAERAGQFKRKPAKPKMYLIIALILNLLLTLTLCQQFAKPGQIAPPKEDRGGKKAELRRTDGGVQQMIQERRVKIQEFDDSVERSRSFADREIADSVQVFAALTSSMQRSQAQFVGENHKATERQAEGFIEELRREIAELEERSSELKQLVHTDNPLHVLFLNNFLSVDIPPPSTRDWRNIRDRPSHEETVRMVVERTLRIETEKKRCDAELRSVRQYAVAADETTLDPDAARRYFILPEDGKRGNGAGHGKNDVPGNTERFSHLQIVVGKQSFSSGRFYYEVQVGGKPDWDLGVAREAINGHRPITLSPDSYWAIRLRNGSQCYAAADPDDVLLLLPAREELQTVGVFVDYEEGVISFYDVEARVHLYSFTDCAFTEELYPYFSQYFHRGDGAAGAPLEIGRLLLISLCSFLVYIYRRR